jgi:hypothetical protein
VARWEADAARRASGVGWLVDDDDGVAAGTFLGAHDPLAVSFQRLIA